ncbi:hypothetical protein BRC96_11175 [Halobacteriales archaeon QS_6_64_34]|nr:MAG: hypothetical protein BRC96_11175 [Halobacteriales archaeon QS_6_64_34]
MYSMDQIRRGIRNPLLIGRQLNKLYYSYRGIKSHPGAVNFLDEDWDNLIILDACRYDSFAEHADLPGELEHRYSLGSATPEFTEKNFAGRGLGDTVYVGANTWFLKLQDEIDAEIHHFVDLQNGDHDVTWVDKGLKVVTPESVTHHAKRIQHEYPNKRIIVHYLQPHHPFIGPTGQKHLSHQSNSLMEVFREAGPNVNRQQLWKAYDENLKRVLETVEDLHPELTGKTVVTADHGEMLGDRHEIVPTRDYGHPKGIYNDTLVKVPWNVIETGERKEIIKEESREQYVESEAVNEQLRDLGYVV